jgi:GTPase SAR1 family protein
MMNVNEQPKKTKVKSKFSKFTEQYIINEDNQLYATNSAYAMIPLGSSCEEKEKLEEEQLLNSIQNLNIFYKENDKEEFFNSIADLSTLNSELTTLQMKTAIKESKKGSNTRSFSFNSLEAINNSNEFATNKKSLNIDMLAHHRSHEPTDMLIKQNLEINEEILKVMVVGGSQAGKNLFVDKIMSIQKNNSAPAKGLEIHSKMMKVFGKVVKLELFDTNYNILNVSLTKIYYKLSHGFVLLCNIDDINSIRNLENQLEQIYNLPNSNNDNTFILCNERNYSEEYSNNYAYVNYLSEKFGIRIHYVNLHKMDQNDIFIDKIFSKILMNKLLKTTKKNKSKQAIKQKQSNNNIKKHSSSKSLMRK